MQRSALILSLGLAALILSLGLAACTRDQGKGRDGPASARVDCAKMLDHIMDLDIAGTAALDGAAAGETARKGAAAGRHESIVMCEQTQRGPHKWTVAQYDCIMTANDMAALRACKHVR